MVLKQNHVIKHFILLISIFIFTMSCTKIDDDYAVLNKVIDTYLPANDDYFYLIDKGEFVKVCLNMHYIYKYEKKKYNRFLKTNNDYINKTVAEEGMDKKYIKYTLPYKNFHKNCINVDHFNKVELEYLMKQTDTIEWNLNKIDTNKIKVLKFKKNNVYFYNGKRIHQNYISKPLYSIDRKMSLVSHKTIHGETKLITLKKINDVWKIINSIENHQQ